LIGASAGARAGRLAFLGYGNRCRGAGAVLVVASISGVGALGRGARLFDRLWLGHRQGLGFRWLLHLGRLQKIDDQRDFHDLRHDCFGGEHHQKNGDVETNNNAKQTAAPG
jgi:hypothetical protein